jgi:glutamine amidotransferase
LHVAEHEGAFVIAIVDYGAGNLSSVKKAFVHLGADVAVVNTLEALDAADRVVLPGVGHFSALSALDEIGLRERLMQVMRSGKPFLGICLGMQWLFEGSEEAAQVAGAGVFAGTCRQFPSSVKSPHVGWNSLSICKDSHLLRGVAPEAFVYYTHSFHAPLVDATTAATDYDIEFSGAVEHGNIFGVQFHPEKSGDIGLQILKNFCEVGVC